MLQKIKPNVIILSSFAALLTGLAILHLVDNVTDAESTTILSMLIGIGIGSLLTIASQVAQDPPPPTVPAHIVEKIIDAQ